MKKIPLCIGKSKLFSYIPQYFALVDDEDFDLVMEKKWSLTKIGPHSYHRVITRLEDNKKLSLHHFVFGKPPEGLVTDHIDRNTLNNQKSNLRFITQKENSQNPRKDFITLNLKRRKGVQLMHNGKWTAVIRIPNLSRTVGSFNTQEEAYECHLREMKKYLCTS